MVNNNNRRKALVVGPGGMRGAYDVGVVTELFKELGKDYFNSVYAVSAGVFISTYFVAGCPEIGEKIWRSGMDGKKVIRFTNSLHGKHIINLEYLNDMFYRNETLLPIKDVTNSNTKLIYVLTDYYT